MKNAAGATNSATRHHQAHVPPPPLTLTQIVSRLVGFPALATRDYIEAVRSRVVVFDGGMGATLEQFDLTQEDYGGLQGKCHEALVLNRPDVIEGVHESMLERRRRGRGDRHLPGAAA